MNTTFEGYLCEAWGETDLPCAEVVRDMDGIRQFMVSQWLGSDDAEDYDGTPTLPRVMAEIEGRDWKGDGPWLAEFEIGGVSVKPVYSSGPTADRAERAAPASSEGLRVQLDADHERAMWEMCRAQGLSPNQLFRQALRLYQADWLGAHSPKPVPMCGAEGLKP